jgi:hypothetical protein
MKMTNEDTTQIGSINAFYMDAIREAVARHGAPSSIFHFEDDQHDSTVVLSTPRIDVKLVEGLPVIELVFSEENGKPAVVIMLPALNVGVKRLGEAILRAVDMAKDDGKKEALS